LDEHFYFFFGFVSETSTEDICTCFIILNTSVIDCYQDSFNQNNKKCLRKILYCSIRGYPLALSCKEKMLRNMCFFSQWHVQSKLETHKCQRPLGVLSFSAARWPRMLLRSLNWCL